MHKDDAQSHTTKCAAQHTSHEALTITDNHGELAIVHLEQDLQCPQDNGKDGESKNRLDAKLQSKNAYGKKHQHKIHSEISNLHFQIREIIDNGGDTRQSPTGNAIRQEECHPAKGVEEQSESDNQIVLYFMYDNSFSHLLVMISRTQRSVSSIASCPIRVRL